MTEELHKRINDNERQIGELTATVGSLAESVGRLHADFQKGISGVYQKIDSFNDRMLNYGRPNWGVVLMAIGALAAFIVLHTQPIKEKAVENRDFMMSQLEDISGEQEMNGEMIATIRLQHELIIDIKDRIHRIEEDQSYSQAEIDNLKQWITQVDLYGSRKWVKSGEPALPN